MSGTIFRLTPLNCTVCEVSDGEQIQWLDHDGKVLLKVCGIFDYFQNDLMKIYFLNRIRQSTISQHQLKTTANQSPVKLRTKNAPLVMRNPSMSTSSNTQIGVSGAFAIANVTNLASTIEHVFAIQKPHQQQAPLKKSIIVHYLYLRVVPVNQSLLFGKTPFAQVKKLLTKLLRHRMQLTKLFNRL